jgi:cytochrome b subunit of formate dehydrogenase
VEWLSQKKFNVKFAGEMSRLLKILFWAVANVMGQFAISITIAWNIGLSKNFNLRVKNIVIPIHGNNLNVRYAKNLIHTFLDLMVENIDWSILKYQSQVIFCG